MRRRSTGIVLGVAAVLAGGGVWLLNPSTDSGRGSRESLEQHGVAVYAERAAPTRLEQWAEDLGIDGLIPDGGGPDVFDASSTGLGDNDLKSLHDLPTVRHVDLRGTRISDAGIEYVAALSQLSSLRLSDTAITDSALGTLSRSKSLRAVWLSNTSITDAGVCSLLKCRNLQVANFSGTRVGDESLNCIDRESALEVLDVSRTQVTGAGIEHLLQLSSLRVLNVARSPIGDRGLEAVSQCDTLQSLGLDATQVTQCDLRPLATMRRLTTLTIEFDEPAEKAAAEEAIHSLGMETLRFEVTWLSGR